MHITVHKCSLDHDQDRNGLMTEPCYHEIRMGYLQKCGNDCKYTKKTRTPTDWNMEMFEDTQKLGTKLGAMISNELLSKKDIN